MTRRSDNRRGGEAGFTLIEMLIVLVIISILIVALMLAMASAKVASRNDAMKSAAAAIDQAVASFNRMYPAVPDPTTNVVTDQLVTRRAGQPWDGNNGATSTALADETGEWLVAQWPTNPFGPGNVRVLRYAAPASCANGQPGEIKICRLGAGQGAQTYEIRAWGRDQDAATKLVYTARHGTS